MKRFRFESDADVCEFVQYLIREDLRFHLDDDPEDILWSKPLSQGEVSTLKLNMIDLWNHCDPWLVLSRYPELEADLIGWSPSRDLLQA
jgi:hypothetical protein